MPGKRRCFLLPDQTIRELDEIAATLPRSRTKMPATRTDALMTTVHRYHAELEAVFRRAEDDTRTGAKR